MLPNAFYIVEKHIKNKKFVVLRNYTIGNNVCYYFQIIFKDLYLLYRKRLGSIYTVEKAAQCIFFDLIVGIFLVLLNLKYVDVPLSDS